MKVRRINKDGDWTFGQGTANYAKDGQAVRQNVLTRLRSFKYDWFLDIAAGIDYFSILANKNNQEVLRREIWRVCRETEGVLAVRDVTVDKVDPVTRRASVSVTIETIYNTKFTDSVETLEMRA